MREEAEKRMKAIDRLYKEILEKYPGIQCERIKDSVGIDGSIYEGYFFLRVWKKNESVLVFAAEHNRFIADFMYNGIRKSKQEFTQDEIFGAIERWIGE